MKEENWKKLRSILVEEQNNVGQVLETKPNYLKVKEEKGIIRADFKCTHSILGQVIHLKVEKDNSPMEFSLFKEDNKAENFSDEFHKKFNQLEDQIIYNQQLNKDGK